MEFCRHIHAQDFPVCEPVGKGVSRQLFTVAAFTRMRYCTQDGCFDWHNRSSEPGKHGDAWYAHKELAWRSSDYRVLFGHWAARGLVTDQPHVLGLDSGCVWGGKLTLARLDKTKIELASVGCPACQTLYSF